MLLLSILHFKLIFSFSELDEEFCSPQEKIPTIFENPSNFHQRPIGFESFGMCNMPQQQTGCASQMNMNMMGVQSTNSCEMDGELRECQEKVRQKYKKNSCDQLCDMLSQHMQNTPECMAHRQREAQSAIDPCGNRRYTQNDIIFALKALGNKLMKILLEIRDGRSTNSYGTTVSRESRYGYDPYSHHSLKESKQDDKETKEEGKETKEEEIRKIIQEELKKMKEEEKKD